MNQNNKMTNMYNDVHIYSDVLLADSYQLIKMLMQGALDKMMVALGAMQREKWGEASTQIGLTISILDGLQISLDKKNGKEIANNLNDLYDYMKNRLLNANAERNIKFLEEVISLLKEIKGGWDGIESEVKNLNKKND